MAKQLTMKANPEKAEVNNSSKKAIAVRLLLTEIVLADPFQSLFPIEEGVLADIEADMGKNGFDSSRPLNVWKKPDGTRVLVDGHTRYQAAKKLGMDSLLVYEMSFEDEAAALEYAIGAQTNRRNLTDAELMKLFLLLDDPATGFRKGTMAPNGAIGDRGPRSSEVVGKKLGVSRRTAERIRSVSKDPELRERVMSRELTVSQADALRSKSAGDKAPSKWSDTDPVERAIGILGDAIHQRGPEYKDGMLETLMTLRTCGLISVEVHAQLSGVPTRG